MELCSMLCGSQDGKGVWERTDTCICMAESICYSTESIYYVNKLCFCSVTQLCLNLCDPMDCSTPGLPILQYLQSSLKFILTEWVMSPNHLILCWPILLLPSVFPASGSFPIRWISTSCGKALELQLQNQSFQWIFMIDFLKDCLV